MTYASKQFCNIFFKKGIKFTTLSLSLFTY